MLSGKEGDPLKKILNPHLGIIDNLTCFSSFHCGSCNVDNYESTAKWCVESECDDRIALHSFQFTDRLCWIMSC